jgi:hypothetical protein
MRYLALGLTLAGVALLALVLSVLGPFDGSDDDEDAVGTAGPGSNVCDRPLPALGSGPISQERFDKSDADMDQAITLAGRGDVLGAHTAFFYGDALVHDYTHDIDGPLRERNEDLAKALCNRVAQIEAEFAFRGQSATIAAQAEDIRNLLRQAAREMGFRHAEG